MTWSERVERYQKLPSYALIPDYRANKALVESKALPKVSQT